MADVTLEKAEENTPYDPTLDFFSEHFDAFKALTTPGVVPPIADAKVYDNISQCYQFHLNPSRQVKAGSSKSQETQNIPERKWLSHQLPVRIERTSRVKNVLTKMESITGPLQLLKKCKDEHIQIKVWTRHSHGVRGYCIGYVTIFDKHWNIALKDVNEIWTRPKRRRVPAGMESAVCQVSKRRLVPPIIHVTEINKNVETCKRHVDQILIRGEQIVMIAALR